MATSHDSAVLPLSAKRVLILFPAYSAPSDQERFSDAGRALNLLARILWMLRSTARSQHVRMYRDYYANPRSPAYMADAAREFARDISADHIMLLTDPEPEAVAATASWANETARHAKRLRQATASEFDAHRADAVVLLHADPLGMGLGQLERSLLDRYPTRTFVLNGRRRFYRLDRSIEQSLNRRRFLAETRVVEALLSLALWPAALALMTGDMLFKRKSS
jgi:hypothetical protein